MDHGRTHTKDKDDGSFVQQHKAQDYSSEIQDKSGRMKAAIMPRRPKLERVKSTPQVETATKNVGSEGFLRVQYCKPRERDQDEHNRDLFREAFTEFPRRQLVLSLCHISSRSRCGSSRCSLGHVTGPHRFRHRCFRFFVRLRENHCQEHKMATKPQPSRAALGSTYVQRSARRDVMNDVNVP